MKIINKIKYLALIVLVATVIINLNCRQASADVGEAPTPGGLIYPGDKNDFISMKNEEVIFSVKKNDGVFPKNQESTYYAHVKASFTMANLTDQKKIIESFFPFHTTQYTDPNYAAMNQVANAKVTVNGEAVKINYRDDIFEKSYGSSVFSGVFTTSFGANSETNIVVEYDLRAVRLPKNSQVGFEYMMETGSQWAGKIEKGKVVFDFEKDITSKAPFSSVNSFFECKDGNLVWEFENLEPTSDHNISFSFVPDAIDTWQDRPSYINDIKASRMNSAVYQTFNIRTDNNIPGGIYPTGAINLVNYKNDDYGWLVSQSDKEFDEWVEFAFDSEYIVQDMKIRGGYMDASYEGDTKSTHYDTFRRPKNIVITYSDNTTQEVTLKDDPSEYQTVKLNKTPTSKIKINFKDAYKGVGGGNASFGVGRIKFAGMTKYEKLELSATEPVAQQKANDSMNNGLILRAIIGASIVVVITAVIVIVRYFKGKRSKRMKFDTIDNIDVKDNEQDLEE